jgi:hypothetical protein
LAGAPIDPRFSPTGLALARSFPARGGNGDAEFGRNTSRRLLALRRDGPHRSPRLFQYRRWRRFRRAALEGRLWRIRHVKLDGLRGLVAAQLGR